MIIESEHAVSNASGTFMPLFCILFSNKKANGAIYGDLRAMRCIPSDRLEVVGFRGK